MSIWRPDPTFYPSPKLAMAGPTEKYAYTALLRPDRTKPDAIGVVDSLSKGCSLFRWVLQLKEFTDPLHRGAGHGDVSFQGEPRLTVDGPGNSARQ